MVKFVDRGKDESEESAIKVGSGTPWRKTCTEAGQACTEGLNALSRTSAALFNAA